MKTRTISVLLFAALALCAGAIPAPELRVRHVAASRAGAADPAAADVADVLARNRFPFTNCTVVASIRLPAPGLSLSVGEGKGPAGKLASGAFRLDWQPSGPGSYVLRVWQADALALTTTFRIERRGAPVLLGGFVDPGDRSPEPANHLFVFDVVLPAPPPEDPAPAPADPPAPADG